MLVGRGVAAAPDLLRPLGEPGGRLAPRPDTAGDLLVGQLGEELADPGPGRPVERPQDGVAVEELRQREEPATFTTRELDERRDSPPPCGDGGRSVELGADPGRCDRPAAAPSVEKPAGGERLRGELAALGEPIHREGFAAGEEAGGGEPGARRDERRGRQAERVEGERVAGQREILVSQTQSMPPRQERGAAI